MIPEITSQLRKASQASTSLVFFHPIIDDPTFKSWFNLVKALLEEQDASLAYTDFLYQLTPYALKTSRDAWEYYIDLQILLWDNELTRRVQSEEPIPAPLLSALERESHLLQTIRALNAVVLHSATQQATGEMLPVAAGWGNEDHELIPAWDGQNLAAWYRHYGSGPAAIYQVMRWQIPHGIAGIDHPDLIALNDLVGYQRQKNSLLTNTERLLTSLPAQHALLYGPRGSGKSSLIKAIARHFYSRGLRLIEVSAQDLDYLPAIIEYVRGRSQYFILYIDDLSFEAYETGYKTLKNLLEGGVESRPANLVVYATSNRRYIIQENYSDRLDGDDLHPGETRQEKLALADRFGLTIYFPSANQALYLEMVLTMAQQRGIDLPEEELISRALTWEKEKSGPSGRAARQFVDSL